MILFINGSSNSGKTTTANILLDKLSNAIIVEVDIYIAGSRQSSAMNRVSDGIHQSILAIQEFAQDRTKNIIVPFPLSQQHYAAFKNRLLACEHDLFFITLTPSLPLALSSRGKRVLTQKERRRITLFYTLNLHKPTFGICIDNSNQTPLQTAIIILNSIRND